MVVAHPLDTVKVRLQTLPHLNFVSVLVNTAKVEGVNNFQPYLILNLDKDLPPRYGKRKQIDDLLHDLMQTH